MHLLGKGFHTLINGGLFSVGTSQSTPPSGQRPRWHSFLPPIDVGPPPNPSLLGPASLLAHRHVSTTLRGTAPNPPPLGSAFLLAHRLVSTTLRGTARRLAYRPVSGSDTICNGPDPPLADIVLFGLSLLGSPQGFKTGMLGEGFHTLINDGLFSSSTKVDIRV